MSHFVGVGIFWIDLNRTDLCCWRLTLRAVISIDFSSFEENTAHFGYCGHCALRSGLHNATVSAVLERNSPNFWKTPLRLLFFHQRPKLWTFLLFSQFLIYAVRKKSNLFMAFPGINDPLCDFPGKLSTPSRIFLEN